MTARTISRTQLVADLKAGMNKPDLMAKYGLSEDQLTRTLAKLVASGQISVAETHTAAFWRCPSCKSPQAREHETCPQCGVIVQRFLEKRAAQQQVEQEPTERPGAAADNSVDLPRLAPVPMAGRVDSTDVPTLERRGSAAMNHAAEADSHNQSPLLGVGRSESGTAQGGAGPSAIGGSEDLRVTAAAGSAGVTRGRNAHRWEETVSNPGAAESQPSHLSTRLGVKLPPLLRALCLSLGGGTALALLVMARPFRDLSWGVNLLLGLLLAVVLSACAWFVLKGVYLFLKVRHDSTDDALISGVVVVAGLVMVGTVVLTCIRAESVRIKYRMMYSPVVREINDDLDKLREGIALEQYRGMVHAFAARLKQMRRRSRDQDPSVTENLQSALDSLRNAGEHWSKLADLEGASGDSLGTAYEDFARIKAQLVDARGREWDSFRTSCRKVLAFIDDKTR
ncbi:MAG: hypothetical protein AB1646_19335 [Thermodesulfobacteriota bacterium]